MQKKKLLYPVNIIDTSKKFLTEKEKEEIRRSKITVNEQIRQDRADKWRAKLQIKKEYISKEIDCSIAILD